MRSIEGISRWFLPGQPQYEPRYVAFVIRRERAQDDQLSVAYVPIGPAGRIDRDEPRKLAESVVTPGV